MTQDTDDNTIEVDGSIKTDGLAVNIDEIDIAIESLTTYLQDDEVAPLLTALKTLRTDPHSAAYQIQVKDAFNTLGISQGAALTYAPYLITFLSDDPFADS